MSDKQHYWLTLFFKAIGGLGGGLLIGGSLYLLLFIGDGSAKQQLINQGWYMLLSGAVMYGVAFTVCHHLVKIESELE